MRVGYPRGRFGLIPTVVLALIGALSKPAHAQFGDSLAGAGARNRAMGGAAVAAPLDPAGALFWNPASITAFERTEMEFGLEMLAPRSTITTKINANAFGPGLPAQGLYGRNGSSVGVAPLPTAALVFKNDKDSPWSFGFGVFSVAGFATNYPASRLNFILQPQAPNGLGLGNIQSSYQLLQLAPTIAIKLTDELSLGFAANLDLGLLSANPGVFAAPSIVQTPFGPQANYPPATGGRTKFGAGFHLGMFYDPGGDWKFGAAVKSPQWFDTYTFNAVTVDGKIARPRFNLDFPLVASVGVSYVGIDRLVLATDVRFFNFRDTNGFRHTGFNPDGSVRGLGWQNVFALGTGLRYKLTDALTYRMGYTFSLNPASDATTIFNLLTPTLLQHSISLGFSYDVTEALQISLGYVHYFESSTHGPFVTPAGPVKGTDIRNAVTADSLLVGASLAF